MLDKAEELEYQLFYWRDNNEEVDFVMTHGEKLIAVEVKSRRRQLNSGMNTFHEKFHPQHSIVVGGKAIPLEMFFNGDLSRLL